VKLSGDICRALGGRPPQGFNYELFLDDKGQKISKSKGNGLTIEEWLRYASPESLSLFMYREPKAASASISMSFRATSMSISSYSKVTSARTPSSGSPIRCGTSTRAVRRVRKYRSRLPCCSISSRRRMPRMPTRCGVSSAATGRA
jgi:hypothetical protein